MEWKDSKKDEPNFDKVNYLTIIKVSNSFVYSLSFFDGEKWDNEFGEVVAFTEEDPKLIYNSLQ